ncbi:hypothetical protein BDV96DRAFT_639195 [Lophiotrema nucula]|uniref:Uncharacterized protein n=1 Tax=Lophiotrema nucula TaxID=690887 RepID=A0A6A5ZW68_9PLEO|nr:hypothetical protein BDV96DRAFT_639195 [Lophiotrema nucula]
MAILCPSTLEGLSLGIVTQDEEDQWGQLVDDFVIGDYLQDVGFKHTVLEATVISMRECSDEACDYIARSAARAFKSTKKGSGLRSLIVDFIAWSVTHECLDLKDLNLPYDVLRNVASRLGDVVRSIQEASDEPAKDNNCKRQADISRWRSFLLHAPLAQRVSMKLRPRSSWGVPATNSRLSLHVVSMRKM